MQEKIRVKLHELGFITLEHVKGDGYEIFITKSKNGVFSVDLHISHELSLYTKSVEFPSLELTPHHVAYHKVDYILHQLEQIAGLDERFKDSV